ncbi:MAG: DUF4957 domain-containing protein [Cyclobacteriaceae bacterium]
MKNYLLIITLSIGLLSCAQNSEKLSTVVKDINELNAAIAEAKPGDELVMANGEWKDVKIRFAGKGTEKQPITLRAETPGEVVIKGKSDLKLAGEYLIVDGLFFTGGYSTSSAAIEFAISDDSVANHCRVTSCVIKDFNRPQRNDQDLWVLLKGRHNQFDQCYLAGKSNRGPTIRVDLAGNRSIKNYHKIINNHFGPRPPKGGPSAETIQLGNSFTSMAPSHTLVANNLFERCNGEVEVISSKTNFNEFRNNVFYKSEGSLVTRHGNYCTVDGNYFIGDDESEQIGGIRLIGTGHWVTNNYFYNLKGQVFRSPLAVMNGIPKSPLNRYIQVTDVVVAHNSWIDCKSPLQFGVGANLDQKDVLPASEIRSERPIRTIVANNLIYNSEGDKSPIIAHDRIDGISFKSNVINNQGEGFEKVDGLTTREFDLSKLSENIFKPNNDFADIEPYAGFEFDLITKDLFGNSRAMNNSIGAASSQSADDPDILNPEKYGPKWFSAAINKESKTHKVSSSSQLKAAIQGAKSGDVIVLEPGEYEINASMKINKLLTLQSSDGNQRATVTYSGEVGTPAFEINPKGELTLSAINLKGDMTNYAFATLKEGMSSLYNLTVTNCEISNFDFVLKAYKHSFSEYISFTGSTIKNCNNGLELSAEDDDKGDYNAENIFIDNCQFEHVAKNVLDYYRGGYDESTVGGNLVVTNSSFEGCGAKEENGILLNTYGIINVDISDNKFVDNKVKLVAQLWGAKNNSHSDNKIVNSGRLIVEENLTLKLMY